MTLKIDQYDYLDSADLFSKVANQAWAVFLDSGVINGKRGVVKHTDFDVIAIKPEVTLVTRGDQTEVQRNDASELMVDDPLEVLKQHLPPLNTIDSDLPYLPGAIGYFSYDLARRFEQLLELAENEEQLPEMAMGIYSVIVVVDHAKKTTSLVSLEMSRRTKSVVTEWRELINDTLNQQQEQSQPERVVGGQEISGQATAERMVSDKIVESIDRQEYRRQFNAVRDHTIEGDCYQVNLSKRFSAEVSGDSWQTNCYLRNMSPAPYGAYFNFPFAHVLSNSPESFIQCRNNKVVTRPIKGTRPRDYSDAMRDKKVADVLLNSPKDRAENVMIVDLMRNDLSRCCELGSVAVPSLFKVHAFANVHHLISTITGILRKDLHSLDLLRKCFPGGSVTGAPKIRAMEIIEELETYRRGLYCGAIGYVGINGDLETNIAIRTIVIKDGVARFSAGGGLVIDSDVNEEYQEIIDKASMMTSTLVRN